MLLSSFILFLLQKSMLATEQSRTMAGLTICLSNILPIQNSGVSATLEPAHPFTFKH